ncbi:MAG: sugar kinase [bacterium]|nr:MAG: sugar kinase [bacterium]
MAPEILAIGEPMLEFNATGEGSLSEAEHFTVGWGGDTSNFCIAASRAGGSVGYITRLGLDEFGDSFMRLWQGEGIDTSRVERDPEASTGIYFISRKGTEHFFTYYRKDSAASLMTPRFLEEDYIRGSRLLHVSGISQAISTSACDTVFAAVATAREAGVTVTYDPNLRLKLWPIHRARSVIERTISMSDVVFPSMDDTRTLTGLSEPEAAARYFLEMGPKVVVIKLGGEGALLATLGDGGSRPVLKRFPPFSVDSVDMAGAGDTFDGAFVVQYLRGRPLDECVRFANAAAALTTTGYGCVSPVPTRQQVEDLMAGS